MVEYDTESEELGKTGFSTGKCISFLSDGKAGSHNNKTWGPSISATLCLSYDSSYGWAIQDENLI